MLRLFALATLMVNPPLYFTMKSSAITRHIAFRRLVEGEDNPSLADTWHEDAIDHVYPL